MTTVAEPTEEDPAAEPDPAPSEPGRGSVPPRRWPPSLGAVAGVAITAWGATIGLASLSDNSFFTHLATGRLILEQGIPRVDPYSYTASGDPWVVQSWLASLLYGVVEDLAGGTGLRLLMGALTAGLAAMVWRLTRPSGSLIGRISLAAIAVGVGSGAWFERPLLFGLLFLGVLLLQVDGELDPRWALPMMWIWVNLHGSFPLGLVTVVAFAVGRRLDGERPGTELRLLRWAVAGTLLGALNPLGPTLLSFPVHLLGRAQTLQYVTEWKAPTFDTMGQRLFLVQVALAIVLVVRKPTYRVAVPLALFTGAALLGLRNVPVASLVLLPGMALGMRGIGSIDGTRRDGVTAVAAVVVAALSAVLVLNAVGQRDYDLETYPVDAVRWMEGQEMLGPDTRLVHQDTVGNYLEARGGVDAPVFIDDRFDMYPETVTLDYVDLVRGRNVNEVLERYDANVVLWERDTPLGNLMEEADAWEVVHRDDDWLVACLRPEVGAAAACPTS